MKIVIRVDISSGIGMHTAAVAVLIFGDFDRFENAVIAVFVKEIMA